MAAARAAAAVPEAPARKLLEPRGYDFVEAAAAPENAEAAELRENAPTLALGAAWAQTAGDARAARDDRAAAAAQREAADRDRAAAARDRSEAAKELAEAHMERESAAARGREDAQASQDDVRKLAWRIVGRIQRRHQTTVAAQRLRCPAPGETYGWKTVGRARRRDRGPGPPGPAGDAAAGLEGALDRQAAGT